MDALSRCLRGWRRPPLILVVFGLAITYAEIAIEAETLAEYGLATEKTAGEPPGNTEISVSAAGGLARYAIGR
jgi:hypothetical protein